MFFFHELYEANVYRHTSHFDRKQIHLSKKKKLNGTEPTNSHETCCTILKNDQ